MQPTPEERETREQTPLPEQPSTAITAPAAATTPADAAKPARPDSPSHSIHTQASTGPPIALGSEHEAAAEPATEAQPGRKLHLGCFALDGLSAAAFGLLRLRWHGSSFLGAAARSGYMMWVKVDKGSSTRLCVCACVLCVLVSPAWLFRSCNNQSPSLLHAPCAPAVT